MKHFAKKYSTTRNIISLLILWILFNIGFFIAFTNLDGQLLDLKLYYNAAEAQEMIHSYGSDGRTIYINGILWLDYLYPIVYSLLLIFIIFRLGSNTKLSVIPLPAIIFDYLENSSIVWMLYKYPETYSIGNISGIFTLLKWSFVIISILVIIVLVIKKVKIK
jgi:hypothetical protein